MKKDPGSRGLVSFLRKKKWRVVRGQGVVTEAGPKTLRVKKKKGFPLRGVGLKKVGMEKRKKKKKKKVERTVVV